MNIKTAAHETLGFLDKTDLPLSGDKGFDKIHIYYMIEQIKKGKVRGEKAHRWLGWIQACIVVGGGAHLEDMKGVNHRA